MSESHGASVPHALRTGYVLVLDAAEGDDQAGVPIRDHRAPPADPVARRLANCRDHTYAARRDRAAGPPICHMHGAHVCIRAGLAEPLSADAAAENCQHLLPAALPERADLIVRCMKIARRDQPAFRDREMLIETELRNSLLIPLTLFPGVEGRAPT